jgi:DNA-binding transcriptional MerR regulator
LRKISRSVEEKILRRWLEGYTQRQAAREFRVGPATVNRVIDDARKRTPDLDELRGLNVTLRKGDSSVVDAVRGAKLLVMLNQRGVGLDRVHSYIGLSDRISSERGVEAEKFIDAGMRLVGLEVKTGKNYEGVLENFEEKIKQIEGLEAKQKIVQEEIQRLMDRKTKLGNEISNAEERLSLTCQELNKAVNTNERLKEIGLGKVADLARFINEFESLGFSANEVRELAQLKKELDSEGIHPRSLLQHFKSTRGLKQMRQAIQREVESEETKLKLLASARKDVEKQIKDIQRIHYLMNMRKAFACSHCGSQFFAELTRFHVSQCLAMGQPIVLNCHRCGAPNTFNPYEVLAKLGFEVLS